MPRDKPITVRGKETKMYQIFTKVELAAKGFGRKEVARMLRSCETRCNSYLNQFVANGSKCSAKFQAAWDAECARWDHLKATLAQFDEGGAA
jgi:hypothetical protein